VTKMIEMVVDSVRVSLMTPERVVILREKDGERFLPIFIGNDVSEGITVSLNEVEVMRPLTWDLILNSLKSLQVELFRVEIVKIQDNIFFGNLVAGQEGNLRNIDSRASDAIALAIRAHVPIFVAVDVMEKAGIVPDENIETLQAEADESLSESQQEEEEKYLSPYEDFLKNLDLGDNTENDKKDDEDENDDK
jgi:bifunctional DNase/RNase